MRVCMFVCMCVCVCVCVCVCEQREAQKSQSGLWEMRAVK